MVLGLNEGLLKQLGIFSKFPNFRFFKREPSLRKSPVCNKNLKFKHANHVNTKLNVKRRFQHMSYARETKRYYSVNT